MAIENNIKQLISEKCATAEIENVFLLDPNDMPIDPFNVFYLKREPDNVIIRFSRDIESYDYDIISTSLDSVISHIAISNDLEITERHVFPAIANESMLRNGLIALYDNLAAKKHYDVFGEKSLLKHIRNEYKNFNMQKTEWLKNKNINPLGIHTHLHSNLPLSATMVILGNEYHPKDALNRYFMQFAYEFQNINSDTSQHKLNDNQKIKFAQMLGTFSGLRCKLIPTAVDNEIYNLKSRENEYMHMDLINTNYIDEDVSFEYITFRNKFEKFMKENAVDKE